MRTFVRLLAILGLVLASGCAGHVRALSSDKPFNSDDKDAAQVGSSSLGRHVDGVETIARLGREAEDHRLVG